MQACVDEAAVRTCLLEAAGEFGFRSLFAGWVPSAARLDDPTDVENRILQHHDPDGWSLRYMEKGYVFRDPVISRLLTHTVPFTWTDAYDACERTEDVRLIRGESAEFGLRDGFVIPIGLYDGLKLGFSFGGDRPDTHAECLSYVSFAANMAVGRLVDLTTPALVDDELELTAREKDWLQWSSEGKTDWEIAVILGISRNTILKHVATVKEKLCATNKSHAVAIALKKKIIK